MTLTTTEAWFAIVSIFAMGYGVAWAIHSGKGDDV